MFLVTILDLERPKYSFGRKYRKKLLNSYIKLPVTPGKEPDWEYMKQYIMLLNSKEISSNVLNSPMELSTISKWKEINISDLFDITVSHDDNLQNSDKGETFYIASSSENNGMTACINANPSQNKNTLTIARNGSVGSTFYQPKPYCASPDDIRILTPKFNMTKYSGLFIKTIIEMEKFRYTYGRKLGSNRIKNMKIRLPMNSKNEPDLDHMENYIKALPYSDRI